MKKLWLALILACLGLAPAQAQNTLVPSTTNQIAITGTVAASTRIVTGISGKYIAVTAIAISPVATSVVTFTYGTGTNCGTGTTSLTGAMTMTGSPFTHGSGYGAVMLVPQGNDLCITIATAAAPGILSYSQF